jgi:hypothetical protein
MKKFFLTVVAFALASVLAFSQDCTTTWPYIYPDFAFGTIYYKGGQKFEAKLNIHVYQSKLHFLDGETIKEAVSDDVVFAEIAGDKYLSVNGMMMKLVAGDEQGYVGKVLLGDFNALRNEGGGAYGASLNTSATMDLSSLEGVGGMRGNMNHMELRQEKEEGKDLPLKTTYYVVTNGNVYEATSKAMNELCTTKERKAEFKKFQKENKIKWNDPNSLLKLIAFVDSK